MAGHRPWSGFPSFASELTRLAERAVTHHRNGGARSVLSKGIRKVGAYCAYQVRRHNAGSFTLDGDTLTYFHHPYNATWRNERAVEIPVARRFLTNVFGPGLEVGNVLGHYGPVFHTVIDKYEPSAGVINVDVVDYRPPDRYGWIVAISTLEHVGWDEAPKDPDKAVRAIAHLRTLLRPGGRLLVTCPVGHNPGLDHAIRAGSLGFSMEVFFLSPKAGATFRQIDRSVADATWLGAADRTHLLWVADFGPAEPG